MATHAEVINVLTGFAGRHASDCRVPWPPAATAPGRSWSGSVGRISGCRWVRGRARRRWWRLIWMSRRGLRVSRRGRGRRGNWHPQTKFVGGTRLKIQWALRGFANGIPGRGRPGYMRSNGMLDGAVARRVIRGHASVATPLGLDDSACLTPRLGSGSATEQAWHLRRLEAVAAEE